MGSYLNLELRLLPPNSDHPANHHHYTDNIVKTSPEEKSEKLTIFYDGIISTCEVTELQARAIIYYAGQAKSESPSPNGSCKSETHSPASSLSMKRSLKRFLQKRKHRIHSTYPYHLQ